MAAGPHETVWDVEPHTLAKHRVIRKYLDAWVPTLGQSLSGRVRVVIIDGLKKMKRSMWSVDPGGGFRFSDRAALVENLVLFRATI